MPKVPTYESQNSLGGEQLPQTNVNSRVLESNAGESRSAKRKATASIFSEFSQVYTGRYEASKKAEQAIEIASKGAEAIRYNRQLVEDTKKLQDDDAAMYFYQQSMGEYLNAQTESVTNPQLKANLYETINRVSLSGEHDVFNFTQGRRKSRSLAKVNGGLDALGSSVLDADSSAKISEIYRQADTLIDTAAGASYLSPDQAQEAKANFRKSTATNRIIYNINNGNIAQARSELDASRELVGLDKYVDLDEKINTESVALEAASAAALDQQSSLAAIEFNQKVNTGEAFDPDPYYAQMNEREREHSRKVYSLARKSQNEILNDVTTLSKNIDTQAFPVTNTKSKRTADVLYQRQVLNSDIAASPEHKYSLSLAFIRKTNYVPTQMRAGLEGSLSRMSLDTSGQVASIKPEEKAAAAIQLNDIKNINSMAYSGVKSTVRKQSEQIVKYMKMGYSGPDAVRKVETNMVEGATNKDFLKQVNKEAFYGVTEKELIKTMQIDQPGRLDSLFTRAPEFSDSLITTQLQSVYSSEYIEARRVGVEPDEAKEQSLAAVKRIYGPSYVNKETVSLLSDNPEIMMYPPENYIPDKLLAVQKDATPKTRAEMVNTDFKAFKRTSGLMDNEQTTYSIISDLKTNTDYQETQHPSYLIVKKELRDGRPHFAPTQMRWSPFNWKKK